MIMHALVIQRIKYWYWTKVISEIAIQLFFWIAQRANNIFIHLSSRASTGYSTHIHASTMPTQ